MTIGEAIRRRIAVVFCARCGWKAVDVSPKMIEDKCPGCHLIGLDAVTPQFEKYP